jgi:penicillin-binding protein 1C
VSTLLIVFLLSVQTSYTIYAAVFKNLPTPEDLQRHTPSLTTKIFDRHGVLLYKIYKDENRSLIKLAQVPRYVVDATVSIEDKDFFSHKGISLPGMIRAGKSILTGDSVQGGSTITQQLVKNTLLSPERTIIRKSKEIILALEIERHFTKNQILEMYLNESAYGGSVYGIEEASRAFFGIPAQQLSLAQAAFLAGLPQAPSLYNPFGSHPEQGIARQHEVLRRMFEDKKISAIQYEQAKNENIRFVENTTDIKAPHFVMLVREQLAKEYGEELVSHGGLQITTSLDLTLQNKVQEIVTDEVGKLHGLHITNGAAVVTNPKTGEILAMVGSTNYFDTKNDGQVNVTTRERQPGSSIKPVTYAAAFERGLTPASLIDDAPISYSVPGSPPYVPKNYDGRFHGHVSVRTALASSYNIPAVKTEASIGLTAMIEKAKEMGITTWDDPSRYGLSLTLGAGEVKMVDMAQVYGTFANEGVSVPLQYALNVKDKDGKMIFSNPCIDSATPCGGSRKLDARIAYQITNILMDNIARSPAFGLHSVLDIPKHQVAVKTGTTNLLRDNWTDGYTSDRVVVVWVGNNDNSPMSRVTSGVIGASPIWNKIISLLLPADHPHVFPVPSDISAMQICRFTGKAPCGDCGQVITEYFLPGSEPSTQCVPIAIPSTITADSKILDGISVTH